MATPVVMPKAGNTVESCIIVEWKKQVGDVVALDDVLCEVETDKTNLEIPSPAAGILLAQVYPAGADVPVMETIAWVGEKGEQLPIVDGQLSIVNEASAPAEDVLAEVARSAETSASSVEPLTPQARPSPIATPVGISPRARHLAERKGVDAMALAGSGPGGRVIERDVEAALATQPKLTPVAKAMVAEGGFAVPAQGSGPGGRVTSKDLVKEQATAPSAPQSPIANLPISQSPNLTADAEVIPVKGVRKLIAERMLQSLQTTAQLTLNASADARALQALRKRLKESPENMGLRGITINDLVLLAVARTLPAFPGVNALFTGTEIHQYRTVHLGVAVDTPKGLMVPVVRNAETLTLRQLATEAKRLATACQESKITPDELNGGSFTVTNMGAFGIESFTPVLNPPQVAILGVCGIQPKPVEVGGAVQFLPHIGLSLTINHQVVDGAPAARFLQALGQAIATIDLVLVG